MKKKVKAFTLIELVVVMAIFSLIMSGAVAMIQPIKAIFKQTEGFGSSRAAMDNITNYLESVVRNSSRMHMYVGWDEFSDINAGINSVTEWDTSAILNSDTSVTSTWGMPVFSTSTSPQQFFLDNFLIGKDKKLQYTYTTNPSKTWTNSAPTPVTYNVTFAHNITLNRDAVDFSLSPAKFEYYVLEILHEDTDGDGNITSADSGNITAINLRTCKLRADGTADVIGAPFAAVNPVYFQNYDFRLVFGEVLTNENGKALPATGVDDFQYYTGGVRAVPGTTDAYVQNPTFFDVSRFAMTLSAKPKPSKKYPDPTFVDSDLTMTSSAGLQNLVKSGNILKEEIAFDVKSSTLSVADLTDITDPTKHGTDAEKTQAQTDLSADTKVPLGNYSIEFPPLDPDDATGPKYSWSDFPLYQKHDPNGIIMEKLFNECWDNTATPPKSTFISPEVNRFRLFFNQAKISDDPADTDSSNGIDKLAPELDLNFAKNQNVFIIFTLPKQLK